MIHAAVMDGRLRASRGMLIAACLAAVMGGCTSRAPAPPSPAPAAPITAKPPVARPPAAPEGEDLKAFYASVERDLIASGRMRRETAPADAPYTIDDLVRDFERIALWDEYTDVDGTFVHKESMPVCGAGQSRCAWR